MRRFLALSLAAALGALGLAACGGDDGNDESGSPASEDTARDSSDDTTDDTGDDTSGDDAEGSGGADELRELLERQSEARIKVTYVTTETDGSEKEMTIAQDGEGRQSLVTDGTLFISGPEGTFSCDGTGSDATCDEVPEDLGELGMLGFSLFTSLGQGMLEGVGDVDGVETTRDEIAGRDALCVDWDASSFSGMLGELAEGDLPDDAQVRICVDEETGFLLELGGQGDGDTFSIRAVEVSEPEDSDFEPPSTPETMRDLGDIDIDELLEQGAGG